MSRKVPVKIGQCSKAMLEGFSGKASYFRSLLLKCCVVKVFILRSTSTVLLRPCKKNYMFLVRNFQKSRARVRFFISFFCENERQIYPKPVKSGDHLQHYEEPEC